MGTRTMRTNVWNKVVRLSDWLAQYLRIGLQGREGGKAGERPSKLASSPTSLGPTQKERKGQGLNSFSSRGESEHPQVSG